MSQEKPFEMEIENDDQPAPNQATDRSEASSRQSSDNGQYGVMFDREPNRLHELISSAPLLRSPLLPFYNPQRNGYLNSLFDRMSITDRHGYSNQFALLPFHNCEISPTFPTNDVKLPQPILNWLQINEAASARSEQSDIPVWVQNPTASKEEQPQPILSLSQINEATSARSEQTDSPITVKHPADSEDAV